MRERASWTGSDHTDRDNYSFSIRLIGTAITQITAKNRLEHLKFRKAKDKKALFISLSSDYLIWFKKLNCRDE